MLSTAKVYLLEVDYRDSEFVVRKRGYPPRTIRSRFRDFSAIDLHASVHSYRVTGIRENTTQTQA